MTRLRREYEKTAGSVSDRHWARICRWLEVQPDDDSKLSLIRTYALLRKMNPRSRIGLDEVRNYLEFTEQFPNATCKGDDLLEGISRVLAPQPSMKTIYRWGQEIGCPFSLSNWYSPREVNLWMRKVLGQQRFKVAKRFPGVQKMAA